MRGIGLTVLVGSFHDARLFVGWLVASRNTWFLLWRFHIIHHADTNVDVATTRLRTIRRRACFRGLFFAGVMDQRRPIVPSCSIRPSWFHRLYASIRLPPQLDNAIGYVLVSPQHAQCITTGSSPTPTAITVRFCRSGTDRWARGIHARPSRSGTGWIATFRVERDEDLGTLLEGPFRGCQPTEGFHLILRIPSLLEWVDGGRFVD